MVTSDRCLINQITLIPERSRTISRLEEVCAGEYNSGVISLGDSNSRLVGGIHGTQVGQGDRKG